MRVTLLGTGTPAPNPRRAPSAVLVDVGSATLLFDAGSGTVRQLAACGAPIGAIDPLFVTHHHFDHIGDLFDVMILTALCGRTAPLRVFGPVGTDGIVRGLLDHVFDRDIRSREAEHRAMVARGLDPGAPPDAIRAVDVTEVDDGEVASGAEWTVRCARVQHGLIEDDPALAWTCLGYRVETPDGVIAISGDTVPCAGIAALAAGADLLIQCCHFPQARVDDPVVRLMTEHTLPSAAQAAAIAQRGAVRHLALTHLSMSFATDDDLTRLEADIAATFDGAVTVGRDLDVFTVSRADGVHLVRAGAG